MKLIIKGSIDDAYRAAAFRDVTLVYADRLREGEVIASVDAREARRVINWFCEEVTGVPGTLLFYTYGKGERHDAQGQT